MVTKIFKLFFPQRFVRTFATAFTLIELLIVVAIIAILAAIAVPNFLEAQTRAKVSRVKADMRSISTALHAYKVDNNKLPRAKTTGYDGSVYNNILRIKSPVGWGDACIYLTTPISYISSFPDDPFLMRAHPQYLNLSYNYAGLTGAVNDLTAWPANAQILSLLGKSPMIRLNGPGSPASFTEFILASTGPKMVYDTLQYMLYNPNATRYFIDGTPYGASGPEYDPTNGTNSLGPIYRLN
ncbi:MAG: prepilin-type N-terminal cleavage/methylation domain-containing protein [Candidatus Sumerlaeota bacterium]|nr:prepilin-type N-terminal cleavage/methylation domain-containing protein [Candidatus Sumerlaeota bacterium]